MSGLTPKQERFCRLYIELGNASEAYRQAYSCKNMKSSTINRKAKELLDNGKITARVKELQAYHAERHDVTVDSITVELEEARKMAVKTETPASMVTASMGKAKLHGLITDKGSLDVTVNPVADLLAAIEGTALRPKQ